MPETATQKSAMPTRKLATAAISMPTIYALFGEAIAEAWPQIAPAALSGPAWIALVPVAASSLLALLVAYFVPDAPNVPVQPTPLMAERGVPKPRLTSDQIRTIIAEKRAAGTLPLRDCDKLRLGMPLDAPAPKLPHVTVATIRGRDGRVKFEGGPRNRSPEERRAFRAMMHGPEAKEVFGE